MLARVIAESRVIKKVFLPAEAPEAPAEIVRVKDFHELTPPAPILEIDIVFDPRIDPPEPIRHAIPRTTHF
jgi:hypothetical protein